MSLSGQSRSMNTSDICSKLDAAPKQGVSLPMAVILFEDNSIKRDDNNDEVFKAICMGSAHSGKSQFTRSLADQSTSLVSTIGVDFTVHSMQVGDKKIKCQLWDTAGQERFAVVPAFFKNANMAFIFGDSPIVKNQIKEIKTGKLFLIDYKDNEPTLTESPTQTGLDSNLTSDVRASQENLSSLFDKLLVACRNMLPNAQKELNQASSKQSERDHQNNLAADGPDEKQNAVEMQPMGMNRPT